MSEWISVKNELPKKSGVKVHIYTDEKHEGIKIIDKARLQ